MKHTVSVFWPLILALVLTAILDQGMGQLPPLGRFLSPFSGVWRLGGRQISKMAEASEIHVPGLRSPVRVYWDDQQIPHIFAEQDHDLYLAQGYLTARLRLWQMDITTRAGLARLSEIFGSKATSVDEFFVRFGMRYAVEQALKKLKEDPETYQASLAYVEGVNAYIRGLIRKDYPIEYQVTNTQPQLWGVERIPALLKIMTFRLAGRSYDLPFTALVKKIGRERALNLFPEFLGIQFDEFIFNQQRKGPRAQPFDQSFVSAFDFDHVYFKPFATNASNNWAVAGSKTKSRYPILSNDTHLNYSLPSVWFEQQLVTPDSNVYGATFPGCPGIILGFNPNLAWGVTNGTTDVLDWYEIEFKDAESHDYIVDGQWHTAQVEEQVIRIKGQKSLIVPQVNTQFGMVMARQGKLGLVAKWVGYEASNELRTLFGLKRASSVESARSVLTFWQAPSQNFMLVDHQHIGLFHIGQFPHRQPGQGQMIMNGRLEKNNWHTWINYSDLPAQVAPQSGWLRSANNRVVGPDYPEYLGWDYDDPYRAQRIRRRLEERNDWTAQDMVNLQADEFNEQAAQILPIMLKNLRRQQLSAVQSEFVAGFEHWDFLNNKSSVFSGFFNEWWNELERIVWEEEISSESDLWPKRMRLQKQVLLGLQGSSSGLARMIDQLNQSFAKAWQAMVAKWGSNYRTWIWSRVQPTYLPHVARFPGFGSGPISMGGGRYNVQANDGKHGATWKLVVEMTTPIQAWSNYPGGQSGHPFDPDYTYFVDSWSRGEMRPVQFYLDETTAKNSTQMKGVFK